MIVPFDNTFNPANRGYHMVYRDNEVNHCPGCGRTHWYVGRTTAECGFCSTALPLAESFRQSVYVGNHVRHARYAPVPAAA